MSPAVLSESPLPVLPAGSVACPRVPAVPAGDRTQTEFVIIAQEPLVCLSAKLALFRNRTDFFSADRRAKEGNSTGVAESSDTFSPDDIATGARLRKGNSATPSCYNGRTCTRSYGCALERRE